MIGGNGPDVPETWRFSIEVARACEQALEDAVTPQTRKVALRTAIVMSIGKGGAFDILLSLVRRGLGGASGDGRQYVSWIHDEDFARAVRWLLESDLAGPINVAAPHPLPNADSCERCARHGERVRACRLLAGCWRPGPSSCERRRSSSSRAGESCRRASRCRLHVLAPSWPEAARDLCAQWRFLNDRP